MIFFTLEESRLKGNDVKFVLALWIPFQMVFLVLDL